MTAVKLKRRRAVKRIMRTLFEATSAIARVYPLLIGCGGRAAAPDPGSTGSQRHRDFEPLETVVVFQFGYCATEFTGLHFSTTLLDGRLLHRTHQEGRPHPERN